MTDESGFAPPLRIVRPRRRSYRYMPVVAISKDVWLDEDGQIGSVQDFYGDLPRRQPTLFVKLSAADFIAELTRYFGEWDNDNWQVRASEQERNIVRPQDGACVATRISTVIHFFGFKNGNYHKIIDPVTMYGHNLDNIWPVGDHREPVLDMTKDSRLSALLTWGVTLRNFCHKNDIEVRPTMGGISAQFLTDKRFYPKARRKVPVQINERVRTELPGNHYLLHVEPSNRYEFRAWYLDQHRAHHYHARTTTLPDANLLFAFGYFIDLHDIAFERPVDDFYGLYCLDLQLPPQYRRSHWITNGERQFVYSNELPHLLDSGYRVNGVYAAWGSVTKDAGLARYARWAEKQLDYYGDAAWLKPLLLSTYGVLATRPRYAETIFRLASAGEDVTIVTGNNTLTGKLIKRTKKLEPKIANVLHRGMIEAATRSESIGLAQWLTTLGFRVLSIYADAVIVEADDDAPFDLSDASLPEPWRCKDTLNHLQFINQQAFVSGEMTKLPGVSGELRNYRLPLARQERDQHGESHLPLLS